MSEFHLRSFIRSVYNEAEAGDPQTLAKEVFRRLEHETDLARAALEQALPQVCQNFLSKERGPLTSLGGHGAVAGNGHNDHAAQGGTPRAGSWKNGNSSGSQRPDEYWQRRLEEAHSIGRGTDWIKLGDCDILALGKMADYREHLSAANMAQAAGAREWSALLVKHNVRTVRQLPEDVLRERLSRSAAA